MQKRGLDEHYTECGKSTSEDIHLLKLLKGTLIPLWLWQTRHEKQYRANGIYIGIKT